MNILIVEDEMIIAMDMKSRLEEMGHSVVDILNNGEDVLKKINLIQPELILMDIRIKGNMDGIELTKQIHDCYEIPIIFMTAFNDCDTTEKIDKTNYYGFMTKPINIYKLNDMIQGIENNIWQETRN